MVGGLAVKEQAERKNAGKPRGLWLVPYVYLQDTIPVSRWALVELFTIRFRGDVSGDLYLTPVAATLIGQVLHQGLSKYPADNWQKGLPLTEIADSFFRHAVAPDELDAESGLPHLAHMWTNYMFLVWSHQHGGFDDRPDGICAGR